MEIRQQGQLRSNAAYLGRRTQRLTQLHRDKHVEELMLDAFTSAEPVPSGSTLPSTECALTQLPGVRIQNGMQQRQRKPPNGTYSFSGLINGQQSKFTWTNFR